MILNLNGISKYYGTDTLFENITFCINEKDKAGLIGVNGAGKSTLFKIITGELSADSGDIFLGKDVKIGYMSQYLNADENATVLDDTVKVFDRLIRIESEIEDINLALELGDGNINELTEKQHQLNLQYENLGGFTYRSKTKSTLTGLGFSESDLSKKIHMLSGGERARIQLAKLLLSDSDLLLLDEPANHLDINAVEWLEDYLASFSGSILVISHDRYFLDKITNKTLEIENKKITVYDGGYTEFMKKKEHALKSAENKYENTMREIKRIENIIVQQKQWNRERNIKTAESKQKSIDRLRAELEIPPDEQENIRFEFAATKSSGNDVLRATNLEMRFDGNHLFKNVNLDIKRGERVFLLGPNGCGKTTLFKLLLGICRGSGEVKFGTNVETGYYDQTQADLDNSKTVIDEIWDMYPQKTQTEIRNACAAFLFKGDDVFKDISMLSGGERARVSLLKLMFSGSNFLMLDEPTNHLDISSREALEQSFEGYDGTMFIISHDRYFINKLADKIYRLSEDGIEVFIGNYEYYQDKVKTQIAAESAPADKPNDYRAYKELVSAYRKLTNAVNSCETEIEQLECEISEIESQIKQPEIAADYSELMNLSNMLDEKRALLAEQYELWENLNIETESEKYDSLR